jgi:hypothetical protein
MQREYAFYSNIGISRTEAPEEITWRVASALYYGWHPEYRGNELPLTRKSVFSNIWISPVIVQAAGIGFSGNGVSQIGAPVTVRENQFVQTTACQSPIGLALLSSIFLHTALGGSRPTRRRSCFRLREQLTPQVDALQQAEAEQREASKSIGQLAAIVQSHLTMRS